MAISITKIFRFEAAHAISGYHGPCRDIHGHSYVLHVTVTGDKQDDNNILVDFKDIKRIVENSVLKELDHALLLKQNALNSSAVKNLIGKIHWMAGEPTAEFLLQYIADTLQKVLPGSMRLLKLRLYETDTSYADWDPS